MIQRKYCIVFHLSRLILGHSMPVSWYRFFSEPHLFQKRSIIWCTCKPSTCSTPFFTQTALMSTFRIWSVCCEYNWGLFTWSVALIGLYFVIHGPGVGFKLHLSEPRESSNWPYTWHVHQRPNPGNSCQIESFLSKFGVVACLRKIGNRNYGFTRTRFLTSCNHITYTHQWKT